MAHENPIIQVCEFIFVVGACLWKDYWSSVNTLFYLKNSLDHISLKCWLLFLRTILICCFIKHTARIKRADLKYGNKNFIIDETRRDTYKQFHPSSYAQNSLLTNFGGERKQLLAVSCLDFQFSFWYRGL